MPERIKARPTIYNGIQMRSRLEAQFAAWMDARHWRWVYEPDCYATPEGQYLPDFLVNARDAEYFIEVKPTETYFTAAILANGDIIRASKPHAHFGIVAPEWKLHTREPFTDLVEWVTGSRDPRKPEPVHHSVVWLPEGPEVNALLAAVHAPGAFGGLLTSDTEFAASLFADDTNRAAFLAIASGSQPDDPAADVLLVKLAGEELDGDPDDAIAGLVRLASHRIAMASVGAIPLDVHQALLDINEPATKQGATDVLLTWLRSCAE